MNTANLQIEGVLVALSALVTALKRKELLTESEIAAAFSEAEAVLRADPDRPAELRAAHVDAICFPLRYLRLANGLDAEGALPPFSELAGRVGRQKPGHERS